MHIDAKTLCADKQSVVGALGNYLGERSINLWNAAAASTDAMGNTIPRDAGGGGNVEVHVQMTTGLNSAGGACTIKAQLVHADDEALTTNLVVLEETAAVDEATAIAGYEFKLGRKLPTGVSKNFGGVRMVTAGEDATEGNFSASIGVGLRGRGWMSP